MSNPMPSVGRIVRYTSYGTPGGEYAKESRAAIITAVHDQDPVAGNGVPYVDLCVINPTGLFFSPGVKYHEGEPRGGTWHWPERV